MPTSATTPQAPPPGVTFDDAPVPASATPPPGVTFDSTPVPGTPAASTNATGQPGQTQPPSDVPTAIQADPNDNLGMKAVKTVGGLFQGIGEGVFGTAAGASDILDRTTGMQRGTVNRYLHNLSTDTGHDIISPQGVGQIGESTAEFLLGDEYLKGLALSDKLAQSAKVAKFLEGSPVAAKVFELGVRALRAGGVQGLMTGVKTGGDTRQAGEQGALGAGLTAGFGVAGETVNAIRNALDSSALQKPLQDGIRNLLSDVADRVGVAKPTAPSIRDAAAQVAEGVKQRASGLYQVLDTESGGAAQRFRDALSNVQDKLADIVGLDNDKEAELLKRQTEIEAAHQKMLNDLEKKGVSKDTLARADAAWKQQSALTDLSNAIRQSAGGLRPELTQAGTKATPETINAKTLFTKVNRLNDRGRLAQAIGQDNANALLQHIDSAYVQGQKIAARNKFAASLAKVAGVSGATAAGVHWAHELLGGQ